MTLGDENATKKDCKIEGRGSKYVSLVSEELP